MGVCVCVCVCVYIQSVELWVWHVLSDIGLMVCIMP